jgi:hypothetical protein
MSETRITKAVWYETIRFQTFEFHLGKYAGRLRELLFLAKVPRNCIYLEPEEQRLWYGAIRFQIFEFQLCLISWWMILRHFIFMKYHEQFILIVFVRNVQLRRAWLSSNIVNLCIHFFKIFKIFKIVPWYDIRCVIGDILQEDFITQNLTDIGYNLESSMIFIAFRNW